MKEIIKKIAVCAAAVLCSLNASAYTQVSGFDGPTWYDAKASMYASGNSTMGQSESSPFLIKTAGQLALLAYKVNVDNVSYEGKYFLIDLQDADIDLGEQQEVDGTVQTLNWVPISESFKGIVRFKGEHFIKGMTIRATGNMWGGPYFFGLFETLNQSVSGARFKDVDFEISRQYEAGSLCGRIDASPTITIENCTATNVRIVQNEGSGFVGGLVGIAAGCTFSHCTVTGSLGGHVCGGLAGKYNGLNYVLNESTVVVEDCHAAVDIAVDDYSGVRGGGLIGECFVDSKAVIVFCSASGSINAPANADNPFMGGLFGYLATGNIEHSASAVSISGAGAVGGLAGCPVQNGQTCCHEGIPERGSRGHVSGRTRPRRIRQTRQHQVRRTVRENRNGGRRERGESHEEHLVQRFREASAHGRASELCSGDRTRRFRRWHDCSDRGRDVHGMVLQRLIRAFFS